MSGQQQRNVFIPAWKICLWEKNKQTNRMQNKARAQNFHQINEKLWQANSQTIVHYINTHKLYNCSTHFCRVLDVIVSIDSETMLAKKKIRFFSFVVVNS